jgi:hypothetical protein
MFSVRVVSHSWLVPIWSFRISPFALVWLSRINVAQEPWRGHACNGLSRNKWHYSSFVSIQLSVGCVPSRPRTSPSTTAESRNWNYMCLNVFWKGFSISVHGWFLLTVHAICLLEHSFKRTQWFRQVRYL